MEALAPEKQLNIFCPQHKIRFKTKAQAVLACEIGGHNLTLGFARKEFWEFCCNCETYWPGKLGQDSPPAERCPSCKSSLVKHYICHECQLVCHASLTEETKRLKQYWVSDQGITPRCPHCETPPVAAKLREHQCETCAATFLTARAVCPFCEKSLRPDFPKLDIAFPTPAAELTQRITDEFGEVKNGETEWFMFVREASLPEDRFCLIPREDATQSGAARLIHYAKYYDCNSSEGERVWLKRPAVARLTAGSWQLVDKGELETRSETTCPSCGQWGAASRYFCGKCGKVLNEPPVTEPPLARFTPLATNERMEDEADILHLGEAGIDNEATQISPPSISPPPSSSGFGAILVVLGIISGIIILAVVVLQNRSTVSPTPASVPTIGRKGTLDTNVYLRVGPDKTYARVAEQFKGARVEVISIENKSPDDWYKVRVLKYGCHAQDPNWCGKGSSNDADEGWMNNKNLTFE